MQKRFSRARAFLCAALFAHTLAFASDKDAANFAGKWNVIVNFHNDSESAVLELTQKDGKFEGSSGALDENGYMPLKYDGVLKNKQLALTATMGKLFPQVGALVLEIKNQQLVGKGTLYNVPVTLVGVRPDESPHTPKTYEFVPTSYIVNLNGRNAPVLRIHPGDSVKTTTVDAIGMDNKRQFASMPGNPHTGPFYIEGAMPGDTLVVHLTSVRTNQTGAAMSCEFGSHALPAWFERPKADECDWNWTLDAATQSAAPSKPSSKLSRFKIPLRPMIGSIGVAPPWNASISAGDLGYHGGNLDYNRIVEGTTLHIPVFRAGALFSLGDGHAAQGDGEITGQGLETSLAVEFKVDLIKDKKTLLPWAEDAEYVMFSGIGNSMNDALQAATAGLYDYLKNEYQLGAIEIAQVLGSSIQYDVAEVVDPRPHVVAKLRKETLAMINK